MASRYSSSSSEEDEIISRYSLRPVKKSILKKEHSGGTYRGSTPPLTPLGGPETERSKLVTFDRPTKKVDGRAKFPGTPTSYPHPPSDPRYSGAKQTHTPVAKQSKSTAKRLLSSIGIKAEPTQPATTEFISPNIPRPRREQLFLPEHLPTHSRDPTVYRPVTPPLDGPQWSPEFDTRSHTPFGPEPTSASLPIERQTPTPLGFSGATSLYTRREVRTPTPLGIRESIRPTSPSGLRRSETFSGAISPQPSLPESLSPDFSYQMASFELESDPRTVHKRKQLGLGRKHKFRGNQFSLPKKPDPTPSPTRAAYSPIPENFRYTSTPAARKLDYLQDEIHFTQREKEEQFASDNFVLNIAVLQTIFNQMTSCNKCHRGTIKICGKELRAGCATYIEMICSYCKIKNSYWSVSGKFRSKIPIGDKEIVKRNALIHSSILGGRLIGVGHNRLELYHAALNIPSPASISIYVKAQSDLLIAVNFVAQQSMMEAVRELKTIMQIRSSENIRTMVSYDGAYQQRSGKSGGGFSRYCFAAAISVQTGKVISYDIACNSCRICSQIGNLYREDLITIEEFQNRKLIHSPHCPAKYKNYASVQLESALAPSVVRDALSRGVVFSGIVTDGDNKTYEILRQEDIYSQLGFQIERLECLAHVAKRVKTNLCKAQEKALKSQRTEKEYQKRVLTSSSMPPSQIKKQLASFKGKLRKDSTKRTQWDPKQSRAILTISDCIAAQIASYYKLAIQRNRGNVPAIIDAINAIYLHLSANDSNAESNHRNCPKGQYSWCRYQAAISNGKPIPSHPNHLSPDAAQLVAKVFSDFGYNSPQFIEKVQDGHTSNHNESLHSVLWSMVHKNEYASSEMMTLGSALAVIRYNDGYEGIRKLYKLLELPISTPLSQILHKIDTRRVLESLRIVSQQQKRYAKKQRRGKKAGDQLRKYGKCYSSGEFSAAQGPKSSSSSESLDDVVRCVTPFGDSPPPIPVDTSVDACPICGGTEEDCIVGIGLGLQLESTEVLWVQCTACCERYHMECVGIEMNDLEPDEDWYCEPCTEANDD